MNDMRAIMNRLIKVEDGLQAISTVLDSLNVIHGEKSNEIYRANIYLVKSQTDSLLEILDSSITEIDKRLLKENQK